MLRSSVLPKNFTEYPLFLFVSCIIPLTYWFEIWVVLPSIFSPGSIFYWIVFIVGHFLLHNVVGNFLAILMCDTSIKGRTMPVEGDPDVRYCDVCETVTPPRSYHCSICNICILKRDHHCIYTNCCVGFYNHRYFVCFVSYITLCAIITLPFNLYFIWDKFTFSDFNVIPAVLFPAALFFFDFGTENIEASQVYLFITTLSGLGLVFCSAWLYFHLRLILQGTVAHEMRKCINIYNFGPLKNVEMVFGKRWHLSWISPFINSPLPCDGIKFTRCDETSAHNQ